MAEDWKEAMARTLDLGWTCTVCSQKAAPDVRRRRESGNKPPKTEHRERNADGRWQVKFGVKIFEELTVTAVTKHLFSLVLHSSFFFKRWTVSSVSMNLTLFVCRDVAGRWRSKSEVTLRTGVIVFRFVVSTQLAPACGPGRLRKQSGHQGHHEGRPEHTCFVPLQ